MKKILIILAVLGLILSSSAIYAANSANQVINIGVSAINELALVGGAVTLDVNSATAGSEPDDDVDASTTYAITTNSATNKKITGALDSLVPAGTTLKVTFDATGLGTGVADVVLDNTSKDLVTTISKKAVGGLSITYTLSATANSGVISSVARTVTYTLTDE